MLPPLFLFLLLFGGCIAWPDHEPTSASLWTWSSEAAILSDDALTELVVEIDYAGTYEPSALALAALDETLHRYTEKHKITILPPTPVPAFSGVHSVDDARQYHKQTRDHATAREPWIGNVYYLHILYLNGQMEDTARVGFYVENEITILSDLLTSIVGPYVMELPGGIREDQMERKTLIHELGHAFGLVNCGVPMIRPHEDPNSPCHNTNPRSVMSGWNWTRPEEDPVQSAKEILEINWRFDADDEADLARFRSTAVTFVGERPSS